MNLQENILKIKNLINQNRLNENISLGSDETDNIKHIQKLLGMDESGEFDMEMDDCVKQFQEFTEIKVDGIVGPETNEKLKDLEDGVIPKWKGCEKKGFIKQSIQNLKDNVVGSKWKSCKSWRGKGGIGFWKNNFTIVTSPTNFTITYKGPSNGLSIAHAANGGDTLHQVYNVLICEINPYLADNKLKPIISDIRAVSSKEGKNSTITISVPLKEDENTYQLDRRGGWGHDPGPSEMSKKCSEINSEGGECVGPIRNVAKGADITEYFITHTI